MVKKSEVKEEVIEETKEVTEEVKPETKTFKVLKIKISLVLFILKHVNLLQQLTEKSK